MNETNKEDHKMDNELLNYHQKITSISKINYYHIFPSFASNSLWGSSHISLPTYSLEDFIKLYIGVVFIFLHRFQFNHPDSRRF